MIKKSLFLPAFVVLILLFSDSVAAQTKQRVSFARGATSASVKGRIKGYAYRDYVVRARSGQGMSIMLDSPNDSAEIVVRNPAGENILSGGTSWADEAPATGDYTIRVLLPRAAARRGASALFRLRIEIR